MQGKSWSLAAGTIGGSAGGIKTIRVSPYSCINVFETGFLKDEEWTASWIANGDDASADAMTVDNSEYNLRPGSLFRKSSA